MNINFVNQPLGYLKNQPPHMLIIFLNRVQSTSMIFWLKSKRLTFFIGVVQEKVNNIIRNLLSVYTRNEMSMPSTNCVYLNEEPWFKSFTDFSIGSLYIFMNSISSDCTQCVEANVCQMYHQMQCRIIVVKI